MNIAEIYLDNAATTKVDKRVVEAMLPYYTEFFGNPSSIHRIGSKAKVAIEDARETIANFINADPAEIYFTGSGTEGSNFVISGISNVNFDETQLKHILTSKSDHKCVLQTFKHLEENGFNTELIDVNSDSTIVISDLADKFTDDTSLVSIIHANNETGSINNLRLISEIVKRNKDCYFHSDAVQSFGKIKIDVKELGVDALSFTAHKIYGPKGIGAVYIKSGTPIESLIYGGPQERNRRGGTENVAGIVGLAEAVKIAKAEMQTNYESVRNLNNELKNNIINLFGDAVIINSRDKSSPYILSVTLKGENYKNDAQAMLMFLDINGIAVSNGAACTSGAIKPSHVIKSMGYSEDNAQGTIRFSFSPKNTHEEITRVAEILKIFEKKFRK